MKNIINKLSLIKGWEERLDEFNPMLSSVVVETDDTIPQIDRHRRYQLVATVGVDFWANSAQLGDAIRTAKRAFAYRVYGDIEAMVHEALLQISNGDRYQSIKACERILDYIKAC